MKKTVVTALLLWVFQNGLMAQCLSGNCKNGKGKYDFGWCVYEGEFVAEKPEGTGTMKYDDYTYTGTFKNGVEDGRGIITYKDGRKEEVLYSNGKKAEYKPVVLKEGEYKELKGKDLDCKTGNCQTGYGTYVFESGNVYSGNFLDFKLQGKGIFYFANGDVFEGEFANNKRVSGTYTYKAGGYYVGTYDAAGNELNGTVYFNNRSVGISNGKPVVLKTEVTAQDAENAKYAENVKKLDAIKKSSWQYPKTTFGSESSDAKMYREMHKAQDAAANYDRWKYYK